MPDDREITPSLDFTFESDNLTFRIARTEQDLNIVKSLRYQVFYAEKGAVASPEMEKLKQDFDEYDDYALHVMVEDNDKEYPNNVVGTVRLIMDENVPDGKTFYTEQFYDLTPLLVDDRKKMELGRACIAKGHRTGKVLLLMWRYTMALIKEQQVSLMFGCASLSGCDPKKHANTLSYLYYHYLSDKDRDPKPIWPDITETKLLEEQEVDGRKARHQIPALIKGYLKLGAKISSRAIVDTQFNTVFTCLYLDIKDINSSAVLNKITK